MRMVDEVGGRMACIQVAMHGNVIKCEGHACDFIH